ncbi:MAG: helix-turn-helix transcriptional regulator [Methylococcaceae bacterium]|nr:helix-turn-helix transcriptional regulator [Methylococcaceae bacterium]
MSFNNNLYKAAAPDRPYRFRANVFIWPNRTLFFGPLQKLEVHAMGAVTINIGLYQPFYMKTATGDYQAYRCVVIPAGCRHELQANGNIVACLMIEKNSIDFLRFRERVQFYTSTFTPIMDRQWIDCFQKIYEEKPSKVDINLMINQLLAVDAGAENSVDARIEQIMQMIRLDPGNDFSQAHLADCVGLSTSRFRHLFSEQSDIPFRRYRMWRRVIAAMAVIHKVDHLTYAAMEAGFTDSAHFNRCFRDSFGVNPSLVFKNVDRFEI